MSDTQRLAPVSLETIGDGAALELFQTELQRVLNNIADLNTDWKKTRRITLEFAFLPNEDRDNATVAIMGKSKLAPAKGHGSFVFLGNSEGRNVAVQNNPRQGDMFKDASGPTGVVDPPGEGAATT